MESAVYALLLSSCYLLVVSQPAPERILFAPSSSLPAEGRSASSGQAVAVPQPATSERQGRGFAFPDGSNRPPVTTFSRNGETQFSGSQTRLDLLPVPLPGLDSNRQLLNLFPTSNGMQVGLDFRLPFFNIPLAKLFSGLGEGGVPGGGLLNIGGGTTGSLATLAAMAITASLLYPKVLNVFDTSAAKGDYRTNEAGAENFVANMNTILGQFNIDGESCLKVALCSIGNARRGKLAGREAGTTPLDIVEDILNLSSVQKTLAKGALRQAREYGWGGGDCDAYNIENKCPVKAETWKSLLANLSSSV